LTPTGLDRFTPSQSSHKSLRVTALAHYIRIVKILFWHHAKGCLWLNNNNSATGPSKSVEGWYAPSRGTGFAFIEEHCVELCKLLGEANSTAIAPTEAKKLASKISQQLGIIFKEHLKSGQDDCYIEVSPGFMVPAIFKEQLFHFVAAR
jgi:hypothetical protein